MVGFSMGKLETAAWKTKERLSFGKELDNIRPSEGSRAGTA